MEVEFQITKEDYIDFYKTQLKENFQKRIPLVAVILFFATSALYKDHFDWVKTIIVVVSYSLLLLVLFYLLPLFIFNNKLRKLIATDPGYSEPKKWIIEEDGLRSEGVLTTAVRNWESFAKAKVNRKYISLTLIDKRFLMVPKSSFASDTEATNFFGLIQAKIIKAQGSSNSTFDASSGIYKKDRPPYKLGFWGFVPLIGAIVGTALILYGIFKYKDKWLILIGVGAICFTIAVYSFFNYADKRNLFSEGFVDMDKGTLNSLVKEIEFYKIQNGKYPENLMQLDIKNQLINVVDPLMSYNKNNIFNYRQIRSGYTLFSSGMDQIPNTKDDIYPTIPIDTSKMGLIIKKQ
ncbi:MAG: hypothetical protein JWQ34_3275 [Mucilaginibacter sp.]|uniref:tripartite tricarboxylate transporter TctB family protein n=1 Tax=Mucilaginibacter sp. TaxID=1882438 RepID=UPI002625D672|nr:tripartite tricarboxylate transporter TctB family protein [Mucilaginibacter sp.]MDB5005050.1 hypothetical protein [Mucilaginibacter sp.]